MKSYDRPRQHIKKQRHYLSDKGLYSQRYGFSSSCVWMWELAELKNWCFWIVVLEKTLESPLDCLEIKPVNPNGNHSGIFIGRTDAEAEAPILWPPDAKSQHIRKDPIARKDWRQKKKGATGMRWLDSITNSMDMNLSRLGDSGEQRSLAC